MKKRDAAICYYCGELAQKGSVDHIIPLTRGGDDSLDNLVWACKSCNSSKGARTPQEWALSAESPHAENGLVVARLSNAEKERIRELAKDDMSTTMIQKCIWGPNGKSGSRALAIDNFLSSEQPVNSITQEQKEHIIELANDGIRPTGIVKEIWGSTNGRRLRQVRAIIDSAERKAGI